MNLRSVFRELKNFLSLNLNLAFLYGSTSYSQEGEDLLIQKILNYKNKGFYVDVGAHHPFRYSNTYLLFKRGWQGINIDADPKAINNFNKARPNDKNICKAVLSRKDSLNFYIFKDPALNTLSGSEADKVIDSSQSELSKVIKVKSEKLGSLLSKYFPKNRDFDFLNIDAESSDYDVIKSNNWKKFRPKVICVEIIRNGNEDLNKNKITIFLKNKGYFIRAYTVNSVIFELIG